MKLRVERNRMDKRSTRTGLYVVRAQSPCCGNAQEIWTVRAKSANEAAQRIKAANSGKNIYDVRQISGAPWRHFVAPMGLK